MLSPFSIRTISTAANSFPASALRVAVKLTFLEMRYVQCTVGETEVQLVLMKAYHIVRLMKMDPIEVGN